MYNNWPKKLSVEQDVYFISTSQRELGDHNGISIETAYFKKIFSLNEKCKLKLSITALSRYSLYINGIEIGHGPAQGCAEQYYCDILDVDEYLKIGVNTIAVKVVSFPPITALSDNVMGPYNTIGTDAGPCLFVMGECINEKNKPVINISTGLCDWYVANDKAVSWHMESDVRIGAFESVCGEKIPYEWNTSEEIGDEFNLAIRRWSMCTSSDYMYGRVNPYRLYSRPVKMQMEKKKEFLKELPAKVNGRKNISFDTLGVDKLILNAGGKYSIDLCTDKLTRGYFRLKVSGGKGSKISITYAESYSNPIKPGDDTSKISSNCLSWKKDRLDYINFDLQGWTDYYEASGDEEIYEPFLQRMFRIVRVSIDAENDLELYKPYYIESTYPLDIAVQNTLEGWQKDIWDMSMNTLLFNLDDCYAEVPYYEFMQYAFDSRFTMLYSYCVSRDFELQKKAIHDFHSSIMPDGAMQARYPSNKKQIMTTYALFWVMMLWDYYTESGDIQLLYRYRHTMGAFLDWYEYRENEDGLFWDKDKEGWLYVDWAIEWLGGVPKAANVGPSTAHNLIYSYTLEMAAKIMDELGLHENAKIYTKKRERILHVINSKCYDARKGLYMEGPSFNEEYSQVTQVWAVLSGAIDGEEAKKLIHKTINDKSLIQGTYPTRFYLFRAMEKTGTYKESEKLWDIWKELIGLNMTTLPEHPHDTRGDSSGWAAAMLYEYTRCFLGIYADKPGYEVIGIKPVALYMKNVEGSYRLSQGLVKVKWNITDNKFEIFVTKPDGIPAKIIMPDGEEHLSTAAYNHYICEIEC